MKKLLLFLFCIPFLAMAQNLHTINTAGNSFSPDSLTINVGDTVTWNNTGGNHNVNATQATFPNNPEGFGNSVGSGWTFQWIFTMPGTYDYKCDPHAPGMSGIIIANVIPVPGCTDSTAMNYDPLATIDDGSCIYCTTLTASVTSVDVNCCGASNGQATVTPTGGTAPYICVWSNGATGPTVTGLTAGTYSCTVTDANGCSFLISVFITEPACLSVASVSTSVSCNGYSDGSVTAIATGGTAPYTYFWSTGQNTALITGLTAGTYSCTVTDANGSCVSTTSITITEPAPIIANATITSVSCPGLCDGSVSVNPTGGSVPPYTYLWGSGNLGATSSNMCENSSWLVMITCSNGCSVVESGGPIGSSGSGISGCTDVTACNYDSAATCDDGSCLTAYGCMVSTAINYDPLATCDDSSCMPPAQNLFFSEYGEGSSNNKYFEIYNPTSDTVDLTNYAFARVNGNPTTIGVYEYWTDFDSGAVILPFDVYIVTDQDADSMILAQADMQFGSLSNGNDGIALVYGIEPTSPVGPISGGYVILDWIGDWNGNPGLGWGVAGVGAGTRDHTLVRKCPISQGDTSWTNAAGTDPVNSQWIVLANNDWNNIGTHTFNTSVYDSLSFTICNGLSVTVGVNTYDSTGIYIDVLTAANGCDSVVVTDLTVLSSSASVIVNDTTICDGDTIIVNNTPCFTTGTYIDTLQNTVGCDSIITTNLTVQTPIYQDITICDGDTIFVGTSFYTATGNYTDTIISSFGCDSIVHTNLIIYSQFNLFGGIEDNTVGGGGFYSGSQYLELSAYQNSELVSAVVYSTDTTLTTFQIRDDNGNVLDSVTANIIPGGHRIHFNYNMSAGSDYELGINGSSNNLFRNNSGVNYPYNFASVASITSSSAGGQYYYFFYDIEIKVLSTAGLTTNYSICDGESITVAGNMYNTTGLYTDSLTSSIGCDSLVFTNLMVYPNITYTNNQTICSGETYLIGGNIYDSTGVYTDSLYTQYGCDSVVTTSLTVLTISGGTTINNQTICFGDSVSVGNNTYYYDGVYNDILQDGNGCDSVIITTLTTLTANYASIFGGILDTSIGGGGFYSGSQHLELSCYEPSMLASAVVYSKDTTLTTFEVRDNNGTVLKDTTVNVIPGGHRIYFNYEMLGGTDYELGVSGASDSLFRNNSGVNYPYNFASAVAITSSSAGGGYYYYYYDIEIMPLATYNAYSICEGDSIVVGANVYTAAGNYTDYFVASNSCDSVVYTGLEVYQTPSLTIGSTPNPAEICLGDTIILEASNGFINYNWIKDNGIIVFASGPTGQVVYDTPTADTWYMVTAVDSTNGCTITEDITVYVDSCILGVEELSPEEGLQVYPNPASEQLTINFTGNATSIKVYNMLGELMIEKHITQGQNSVQLFVKEWKGAMYSMQLYRENRTITHKVFTVVR